MLQSELIRIYESFKRKEPSRLEITACVDGKVKSYIRKFIPRERVIILGAGHVAMPTCDFLAKVGFDVIIMDDRPECASRERFPLADQVLTMDFLKGIREVAIKKSDYVILMTREHQLDYDCLNEILKGEFPNYLGMLGSRKRVRLMFERMVNEGVSEEKLAAIHTPIGLNIGAMTVDEIALSIAAELVSVRRNHPLGSASGNTDSISQGKKTSKEKMLAIHPQEGTMPVEHIKEEVLAFAAGSKKPMVMLTLVETYGATPAKAGSVMFLDQDGRMSGTIGGGAAENLSLKKAKELIGSGRKECFTIDLDGKVDQNGLMMCGGTTVVVAEDVELV